ncbi:MAG: hypothetical protein Q8N51_01220 [Gammaproteobacteria bacterium]|nr:hypothetical protein [Gammaproteobacteria bacterium]
MPAIKEYFDDSSVGKVVGSLRPDELSDYDKAHLNDLKFKIRNSQLKRRKETMSKGKLKIVLDEREGGFMLGVMDEGADPVISTVPGDLATVLQSVPGAVTAAQDKWKVSKRHPAYTPPAAPKPAPKVEKAKPVADLPLLAVAEKPAEALAAPASEAAVASAPVAAAVEASAPATPEKQAPETKGQVVLNIPPTGTPPKESFYLDDGRGPFGSVQEAFDALGMDKEARPHHNRWDRLSEAMKKKVIRKT